MLCIRFAFLRGGRERRTITFLFLMSRYSDLMVVVGNDTLVQLIDDQSLILITKYSPRKVDSTSRNEFESDRSASQPPLND